MKNKTFSDIIKAKFENSPKGKDFIMCCGRFNKRNFSDFYVLRTPENREEAIRISESFVNRVKITHKKAWGEK